MDFFTGLGLAGGLAFFLYGMHTLSEGLEKMAGGNLEHILRNMTSTKFKGLLLGTGMTIALQSSSTLTVILVGLVNSGIMDLNNTVGVIMGSHIGTTLTAWILSLSGIESSNAFVKLLKPENFSPIMALVGIILLMCAKKSKNKDIGQTLLGFSVLMYGMKLMSSAVSPLADEPYFQNVLVSFSNPVLGVLVGAVFTGIIQSSAASIGILQAFALTGSITGGVAIPIIMGLNIGTCATALLSSIGVSPKAKKVGIIHISFNTIGAILCLILFCIVKALLPPEFLNEPITVVGIAAFHSFYNILNTIILYPFSDKIASIANVVIKDKTDNTKDEVVPLLDELLLRTPSFAISECNNVTNNMAILARETVLTAAENLTEHSEKKAELISENEEILDKYEDRLGTFLVKLSTKELSDVDSNEISKMLHSIGDFERLGDHSLNIMELEKEMRTKKIAFSDAALRELNIASRAISDIIVMTFEAYINNDIDQATYVEPLEQVIDEIVVEMTDNHIERLKAGACTIELGFIFNDILANYERISDHCSNIAVAIIEVAQNSFGTHEYLSAVKTTDNEVFRKRYKEFRARYKI